MTEMRPKIPSCVHLYDGVGGDFFNIEDIKKYILDKALTRNVEAGADPAIANLKSGSGEPGGCEEGQVALQFARCKITDLTRPHSDRRPLPGEVEYEKKLLRPEGAKAFGIIYDGERLQELYRGLLPQDQSGLCHLHIIFTRRLCATFDEADRRYHARVALYGSPSLVSTSGAVEAPAKPREFYILRDRYALLAQKDLALAQAKAEFRGRFLEHGDQRTTEVLKGYALQAIFYRIFGDPFCEEKTCRLFNAHWQEEMLDAQLRSSAGLCPRHQAMLS